MITATICKDCGANLYTFWFTPASDHPELGGWFVECELCLYKDGGEYISLDEVRDKFGELKEDK